MSEESIARLCIMFCFVCVTYMWQCGIQIWALFPLNVWATIVRQHRLLLNAARPKGDDRSAAQVAAQKVADAARPKGDNRSEAQVAA